MKWNNLQTMHHSRWRDKGLLSCVCRLLTAALYLFFILGQAKRPKAERAFFDERSGRAYYAGDVHTRQSRVNSCLLSLNRVILHSFILSFFILSSCTPQRPSNILSEDEMEDILVDYHLAMAMAETQTGNLPDNRYILTQAALKKHDITEVELDTSLVYWCRNSEKMVKICERVSERLSYMAELQGVDRQEKNRYSYLATEGDTANVWNLRNSVVLIPNVVDNIYSFSIDADTTFMPGDYFMWAFKTQFMTSDQYNEAYALLSIQYDNDSIVGTSQRLSSSRETEIRLSCVETYRDTPIRSVNGTIYLPLRKEGFGILAISDFVLVRYHDLTKKDGNNENVTELKADTIAVQEVSDTARVRSTPYEIRGDKAERRTIDIVKDKPIRIQPRRR